MSRPGVRPGPGCAQRARRPVGAVLSVVLVAGGLVVGGIRAARPAVGADAGGPLRLEAVSGAEIVPLAGDGFAVRVRLRDGGEATLSPEAFSAVLASTDDAEPSAWQRVLNIRSPVGLAWVAVGLLGQLAFMLRMLVQWLVSERRGRSVVPVGFWWISLVGASMLLAYFAWRRDLVGVLGQSMGFVVYVRNLRLIHRGGRPAVAG
jgi:lipid-A-disaccharide synthase-like uncharacterized protein